MPAKKIKILVEVNGELKIVDNTELRKLNKKDNINLKIHGTINPTNKLNKLQLKRIEMMFERNIHYLAKRDTETLRQNFKSTVLKELKQ